MSDGARTSVVLLVQVVSHLELVFLDEDDELERGPSTERHLVQDLLSAPVLLRQRVADNTLLVYPRVEVKHHVGSRLHTAATSEIQLEPARRHRRAKCEFIIRREEG